MKILFIGHDISYVQFYTAITKELSIVSDIECHHIYLRPSASIYAKLIPDIKSSSLSLSRLTAILKRNYTTLSDKVDFGFYKSQASCRERLLKLNKIYSAYKNKFLTELADLNKLDVVILPGEYRLFEQAIINVLTQYSPQTRILYFEAGPPGYVYIDRDGVNANSSITRLKFSQILKEANKAKTIGHNFYLHRRMPLIFKNLLLWVDLIWLCFARLTGGLGDLEEYWLAAFNGFQKIISKITNRFDFGRSKAKFFKDDGRMYVMFVSQVSSDVNSTHFGVDDEIIHLQLCELLSASSQITLLWRNHPLEKKDKLFNEIKELYHDRIINVDEMLLDESLQLVNGVITVNSNAGIESLLQGVPVYLLGKAYYQLIKGVSLNMKDFITTCKNNKKRGPNKKIIEDAAKFQKESFFPINYRGGCYDGVYFLSDYLISIKNEFR